MYYMLRVSYTASCYRLFGSWGLRNGGARGEFYMYDCPGTLGQRFIY